MRKIMNKYHGNVSPWRITLTISNKTVSPYVNEPLLS